MASIAEAGDTVEWWHCDRRGTRRFQGVVLGDSNKKNTHIRVRTEKGVREVHRFHARKFSPPEPTPSELEN